MVTVEEKLERDVGKPEVSAEVFDDNDDRQQKLEDPRSKIVICSIV
jgi:hypothetical protein